MSRLDPQPPERPDPAAGSGPARDPDDAASRHPQDQGTADQGTADQATADQTTADQGAADQGAADQGAAGEGAADQGAAKSTDLTVVIPAVLDDTAEMPPVVDPPAAPRPGTDPPPVVHRPVPDAMIEDPVIADLATARPAAAQPPGHRRVQPPAQPPARPSVQPAQPLPPLPPLSPEPPAAPRRPSADRTRRARLSLLGAGAVVVIALLGLLVRVVVGGDGGGQPRSAATVKVAGDAITAAASSTQDPEGRVDYVAANTLDGDPATAWNSDGRKDGPGPGISLTYTFAAPQDLRGITILNGYQKRSGGTDLWRLNERLHEVRVVTDAGSWTWTLADSREPQTLSRDLGRTGSVRLEVVSIYRSQRYLDVGVSEVSFTAAAS